MGIGCRILLLLTWLSLPFYALSASSGEVPGNAHEALRLLDQELERRDDYVAQRRKSIDSLRNTGSSSADLLALGQLYTSFNNDSALIIFTEGLNQAKASGDSALYNIFRLRRAALLPLAGINQAAIDEFNSVDTTGMTPEMYECYYSSGRQLYSHISAFHFDFYNIASQCDSMALDLEHKLLCWLTPGTVQHTLHSGQWNYGTGRTRRAAQLLQPMVDTLAMSHPAYAIANHILADIARKEGDTDENIRRLALSAIGDLRSATLEVTSLQELGRIMFSQGDVTRAHTYLNVALANAVQCHAKNRVIQTSESLPLIQRVHRLELRRSDRNTRWVIAGLALLLTVTLVLLIALKRQAAVEHRLRASLEQSNHLKEVYISQFLNLCSIYMDRLDQFSRTVANKISTGQIDELRRLTRSGKFSENRAEELTRIFDDAFLHIYPNFVDGVNRLLRPDAQIVLQAGEKLNTDLRILAFMRLGVEDTAHISRILGYSVNTIYAYRNRLRARAINRDTFEADVAAIP